jgi:hypothetical protein
MDPLMVHPDSHQYLVNCLVEVSLKSIYYFQGERKEGKGKGRGACEKKRKERRKKRKRKRERERHVCGGGGVEEKIRLSSPSQLRDDMWRSGISILFQCAYFYELQQDPHFL